MLLNAPFYGLYLGVPAFSRIRKSDWFKRERRMIRNGYFIFIFSICNISSRFFCSTFIYFGEVIICSSLSFLVNFWMIASSLIICLCFGLSRYSIACLRFPEWFFLSTMPYFLFWCWFTGSEADSSGRITRVSGISSLATVSRTA